MRIGTKVSFPWVSILLISFALSPTVLGQGQQSSEQPRACRSVHLFYPAPESTAFYNEVTITKSTPGTYFMACGFSKGYFGIQELSGGKKIVLFSVWEPGKQNNPNITPEDRRVKELAAGENVRVKRFGGEGTGGQSFYDYQWKIGQTCRFVVYAKAAGDRTEYAGYFYVPEESRWQHMATFSTLADKHLLRGYYSFVEDFVRNGKSAQISRRSEFGNGWVLTGDATDAKTQTWQPLTSARFSADNTPTDNIDAGSVNDRFFLATGGDTRNATTKLREVTRLAKAERKPPLDCPDAFGNGSISKRQLRILSYNIKHGRGNDQAVDLKRTASVIRRLNPDIVALQEVDANVKRSGNVDEPVMLARQTGLPHHEFGSFFKYQGGDYGMAILSRFPIENATNLRLPNGAEERTSLIAEIAIDDKAKVSVADVHFYQSEAERLAQANTLLKHLSQHQNQNDVFIVGDFNSTPGSAVMNLFAKNWLLPDKGEDHFTFAADNPNTEIDFAMTKRESNWTINSIDVIEEPMASDHRPLVMDVELNHQ
jgi:endonuclease/exonuclease/phosphatase family metal-dependent hydrolase